MRTPQGYSMFTASQRTAVGGYTQASYMMTCSINSLLPSQYSPMNWARKFYLTHISPKPKFAKKTSERHPPCPLSSKGMKQLILLIITSLEIKEHFKFKNLKSLILIFLLSLCSLINKISPKKKKPC